MISAGAVAKDGIARKIGDKKREIPNRIAVVRDVKPVRPPSVTPEALSTNVVVVEVPSTAPTVVATDQSSECIKKIYEKECKYYNNEFQ